MESNVAKEQKSKGFSKKFLFVKLLILFLIEYLLMVIWGFFNIIFALIENFMMGLNISFNGFTQFFLMFFDFVRAWLYIPSMIIYFVGIPVLCYFFIEYLYNIKQDLTEIKEYYKKIIINQNNQ